MHSGRMRVDREQRRHGRLESAEINATGESLERARGLGVQISVHCHDIMEDS